MPQRVITQRYGNDQCNSITSQLYGRNPDCHNHPSWHRATVNNAGQASYHSRNDRDNNHGEQPYTGNSSTETRGNGPPCARLLTRVPTPETGCPQSTSIKSNIEGTSDHNRHLHQQAIIHLSGSSRHNRSTTTTNNLTSLTVLNNSQQRN